MDLRSPVGSIVKKLLFESQMETKHRTVGRESYIFQHTVQGHISECKGWPTWKDSIQLLTGDVRG